MLESAERVLYFTCEWLVKRHWHYVTRFPCHTLLQTLYCSNAIHYFNRAWLEWLRSFGAFLYDNQRLRLPLSFDRSYTCFLNFRTIWLLLLHDDLLKHHVFNKHFVEFVFFNSYQRYPHSIFSGRWLFADKAHFCMAIDQGIEFLIDFWVFVNWLLGRWTSGEWFD